MFGTLHVDPAQHPDGQVVTLHPSHAPASQCCPLGHAAHADPAAPHDTSLTPLLHTSPSQHPVHDAALQRQTPSTHASPDAHGAPHAPASNSAHTP
jgi:hypothetical protein